MKLSVVEALGVIFAAVLGGWLAGEYQLSTTDKEISAALTATEREISAARKDLSVEIQSEADQSRSEFFRQDRRQIYAEYLGNETDLRKLERQAYRLSERVHSNANGSRVEAKNAIDKAGRKLDEMERTKAVLSLAAPSKLNRAATRLYNLHLGTNRDVKTVLAEGPAPSSDSKSAFEQRLELYKVPREKFIDKGRDDLGTE